MADEVLAPLVTFLLLAGLFAWVPVTAFCNDRYHRLLAKRAVRRENVEVESRGRPQLAQR